MSAVDDIKKFAAKFKRGISDVVGLDVSETEIAAARIRKNNDGSLVLTAADILPAPRMTPATADAPANVAPCQVPPKLKARYASLAMTGDSAIIKLLTFPGAFDENADGNKVIENIGVDKPDNYRISFKLISAGHAKAESRVLAVAVPEPEAQACVMLLPSGIPAPHSLEISALSAITAFLRVGEERHRNDAVGIVEFGRNTTTFSILNKNTLVLIRRFPAGTAAVMNKIQESLGVDQETAQGIVSDGSFDISQSINDIMDPVIKQMIVSRDFVERRENCQMTKLYISGGLTVSRDLVEEMKTSLSVEVSTWSPFEGLTVPEGAVADVYKGQEWRFAAAVGACLATFEET